MSDSKIVFVIMPFSSTATCSGEQWTEIYENVFFPAIESVGYVCERAVPETGSLIASIVAKLRNSHIVLADVTDSNSNVFYELGVRHSLSKRTIVITQNSEDVPSDLKGYWFTKYGTSPKQVVEFRKEITRLIRSIEENPDKTDNPVSDYLEEENVSISRVINRENVKKLGALYTEFSGNLIVLHQLLAGRSSGRLISTESIRLLLRTLYLDLGSDLLKKLYELNNKLRLIELEPLSEKLVKSAIEDLGKLSDQILSIRSHLTSDDYREPESISLMKWESASLGYANYSCSFSPQPEKRPSRGIDTLCSDALTSSRCVMCGAVVATGSGVCMACDTAYD